MNLLTMANLKAIMAGPVDYRYFVHTQDNHFKYYVISDTTGEAFYGRIGRQPVTVQYSIEQAKKKIREKLGKGYREVHTVEEMEEYELMDITD